MFGGNEAQNTRLPRIRSPAAAHLCTNPIVAIAKTPSSQLKPKLPFDNGV